MPKYLTLLAVVALALAGCDAAAPTTPDPDPTPSNRIQVRYFVQSFGEYPSLTADAIWYLDAEGDTVQVTNVELPWFVALVFDRDTAPDDVYVRARRQGPRSALGLRVGIIADGTEIANQELDGDRTPGSAINDLEVSVPFFAGD